MYKRQSDYWTEDMVSEDGEILSYILRMPKQHQEVLILYYYDEFSTKEIAKILDIPQGLSLIHIYRWITKKYHKMW